MRPAALPCVLLVSLLGCSKLTAPVDERVTPMPEPQKQATAAPTPTPAPTPPPAPTPAPTPARPAEPKIKAAHILVAYKGAMRADPTIVRSKEDAKKLATQLMLRAKAPKAKFDELAKKSSDDKGSGANGGDLGEFTAGQMVKPFSDAAFALKPGEVSAVVESPFGFHVIKRAP
jgi:peptidyl-prolyl cis-trans isomerase NIMA-interacting 1